MPANERVDQLSKIQRIAGCAPGELEQSAVRPAAGQGSDHLGHCRAGQPGELEVILVAGRLSQGEQVVAAGYRSHHPDEQERQMAGCQGQPLPQGDAGRVGPLQIVDDQDNRAGRGFLRDQCD